MSNRRSAWLNYRGELTDFFSDPKIRSDVLKLWNDQKDYPKINTYFGDGSSFISYFEARLGLRPKLIDIMYQNHYIPSFGVAGLNEIGQEAAHCLGSDFKYLESKPIQRPQNKEIVDKWLLNFINIASFFDNIDFRYTIVNHWNSENVPQIVRHYASGSDFLSFFNDNNLKCRLLRFMITNGYIPFGMNAALLGEIEQQLRNSNQAPDLSWAQNATVDCSHAAVRVIPIPGPQPVPMASVPQLAPIQNIDQSIIEQQRAIEKSLQKKPVAKRSLPTCPICFNEEDVTSSLDCAGTHVYCNDCAQQILMGTKKCAICQQVVTKVTVLRFSYLE